MGKRVKQHTADVPHRAIWTLSWQRFQHCSALAANAVVVIAALTLLVHGYHVVFLGLVTAYAALFVVVFFAYRVPNYLRARRLHDTPTPPLELQLGSGDDATKAALSRMEKKETRNSKGRRGRMITNVLYESVLNNDDGDWHYWAETRDGKLIAYDYTFRSAKSRFLDHSFGRGGGSDARFLRHHDG